MPVGPFARLVASTRLPRSEAITLLASASGHSRASIVADGDAVPTDEAITRFRVLAARREAGEPMAYLLDHREFFGRPFSVDSRVLIPRPDTELLVERSVLWIAVRPTDRPVRVLELGTGSGVLAITLALEHPTAVVVATDISAAALDLARHNATTLGATVRFLQSDWFAGLDAAGGSVAEFDLIVSNPPYIAGDDPHLLQGDLRFEPRIALTDGADGLTALRHIVSAAVSHLPAGGVLMVEHGHDQAAQVRAAMSDAGYIGVGSARDLAGIERVSHGTRTACQHSIDA